MTDTCKITKESVKEMCKRLEHKPAPDWWWEYRNKVITKINNGEIKSEQEMNDFLIEIATGHKREELPEGAELIVGVKELK